MKIKFNKPSFNYIFALGLFFCVTDVIAYDTGQGYWTNHYEQQTYEQELRRQAQQQQQEQDLTNLALCDQDKSSLESTVRQLQAGSERATAAVTGTSRAEIRESWGQVFGQQCSDLNWRIRDLNSRCQAVPYYSKLDELNCYP